MKKQFIAAILCGSMVAGAVLAQQKADDGIRLHCPFPASHPAKIVRPVYPESAKETRVQGRVSLVCLVSKDRTVRSVEVKAGPPLLIKAAADVVSQWKFDPMLLNGKAVEFETTVNVDFRLPKVQKNATGAKPAPVNEVIAELRTSLDRSDLPALSCISASFNNSPDGAGTSATRLVSHWICGDFGE